MSKVSKIEKQCGAELARIRKARGISQVNLAKKLKLSQATWSKIERGEVALRVQTLDDAARVLGTKAWMLLLVNA